MPIVIAAPRSKPGNKPASTSPAVFLSEDFCGSAFRGLLVPVAAAVAETAVKDEALVVVASVEVDIDVVLVLVITTIVSVAFVSSFIRHAPSSAHSKPSGQQPFPHVGNGIDVSLTCTGVSGNWLGSINFVSQVMGCNRLQSALGGQHNAACCAPVLLSRMHVLPVAQQKLSGRSSPHVVSPSLPAHVSRGSRVCGILEFATRAEAVRDRSAIWIKASRPEGSA